MHNGCDTIYRVLEDVTQTLRETQRWAVRQSAKKLTSAQGRNVEREIVTFDGCKRTNAKRDAGMLEVVGDASVELSWTERTGDDRI